MAKVLLDLDVYCSGLALLILQKQQSMVYKNLQLLKRLASVFEFVAGEYFGLLGGDLGMKSSWGPSKLP